jgi:hypothetical protein
VTYETLRSFTVLLLGVFVAAGCGGAPDTAGKPDVRGLPQSIEAPERADSLVIGVKIYDTERELPGLFDEWRALGINTVFAGEELTSSGGFRALARQNDIDLFIIFPVFFAPETLAEDPDLWAVTATGDRAKEDWVEFACPSRADFRARRIEEAREIVRRLQPDGLSIDFIRDFVFWEMVAPDRDSATLPDACYCFHCLRLFADRIGADLDLSALETQDAAAWIAANAADQWVRSKTETITSMVEEIVSAVRGIEPDILINIHVVPWRTNDFDGAITRIAGQNRAALGAVADYLSPMAYSFMLHRPPEWVASVVEDLDWVADCPVLPSIQVASAYREGESLTSAEFEAALRAALEPPSAGVVFWSWDHIEANPGRAESIRSVVRSQ